MACTSAVAISINASAGHDPVPLFEAGKKSISCVQKIEALGQIDAQHAVFSESETGPSKTTFGSITIIDPTEKISLSAQSGTPYYVAGVTYTGRTSQ